MLLLGDLLVSPPRSKDKDTENDPASTVISANTLKLNKVALPGT